MVTSKVLVVNVGGSQYRLENYFPSGKLNSRGDDKMTPVADFNTSFVHFSVGIQNDSVPLLYVNGRKITEIYKKDVNDKLIEKANNQEITLSEVTEIVGSILQSNSRHSKDIKDLLTKIINKLDSIEQKVNYLYENWMLYWI